MSPSIFREKGYRFYFLSNEEERMHIHVTCEDGEAKFLAGADCRHGCVAQIEPEKADGDTKNR